MHFIEDTLTAILVRQMLGAVAEFEKTTLARRQAGGGAQAQANCDRRYSRHTFTFYVGMSMAFV